MGPHEPYWRTNTSFSPPPPRWDMGSFGSQEGSQLYESSTSSNSRETRSWLRGNYLPHHRHSASDGVAQFVSSPSDVSPAQQWTPSTIQEIGVDEFGNSSTRVLGPLSFSPTIEGISISAPQDNRGSISSHSDNSDYDPITKSHSSHRTFTNRRSFMSKPVHPLTFPTEPNTPIFTDNLNTQTDPNDLDSTNVYKCGLCERFLSQRSPWSSRRIIKSGDFPVTGVLSCRHVFHAECLDQTTPKVKKNDPACPVCAKSDEEIEKRVFSRLGPSKQPWGCTQGSNCVEGVLSVPSRNTMLVLNRNRVKKSLSLKGNPMGQVGCSKTASGSGKSS